MNSPYEELNKALTEVKTPTQDRYGYYLKSDGTVAMFGPISLADQYVPTNHQTSVKIHKVK